jgi:hypothetical protein
MIEDPEIRAMMAIAVALEGLDGSSRRRVLSWAAAKFVGGPELPTGHAEVAVSGAGTFQVGESLAEFFYAVDPTLEREKTLTTAYWLQFVEGQPDFTAQDVNSRLKDLGHGIGNITEAFYQLQSERPALVLQLRKAGSSRQARKTYKVTDAGRKAVEALFSADRETA